MSIQLPALPEMWSTTRLDRVASVNARIGWKALTADEYQADGYAFLSTPNIKSEEIDFKNVNFITRDRYVESPELKLQMGDVLLAKDGNTLGIVNIVKTLPRPATVNGSIAVIRPFNIDATFLKYLIESQPIRATIDMLKGGMGVPHLFQWDIKRLPIPFPPMPEQRRIADFLDAETSRMDKLARSRKKQLSLLWERLDAVAQEATGRVALRAITDCTPTKLGRALVMMRTGTTPSNLEDAGGVNSLNTLPWYTPAALDGALQVSPAGKKAKNDGHVPVFPAGSILVTGIGESLGKIGYLTHTATGNQQLTALFPAPTSNGRFIAWQLNAARHDLRSWAQYSRVRIINNETLANFPMSLPEKSVQDNVTARLDEHLVSVGSLNDATIKFIAAIQERRRALITAAVTGQFDLSTASGRGVTE